MTAVTLRSAYHLPVSEHLVRAERDALRIHAQQILAIITSEAAVDVSPAVFEYLLVDLDIAAKKLARDYAENEDRAFHHKEYDKWTKIAETVESLIERQSRRRIQAPPHAMGSAAGTHLLGDITNLSYVMAMGAVNILKDLPTVVAGFSAAATASTSIVSTLASGMQMSQSYFALIVFVPLLIFELSCVFRHWQKRENDNKEENTRAKFLEHGRWMQLLNASVWIGAAVTTLLLSTFLASASAVPILAVMAVTILVTGMIRAIHQAVELTKLNSVLKQYREQLADKTLPPEKRTALELVESNLVEKIKESQHKLGLAIGLPLTSILGIVMTAVAIAIGFTPFLLLGAAILLAAGIATIVINRKAIGAAFKAVGEKLKKKEQPLKTASPPFSESVQDDHEDMDSLMVGLSESEEESDLGVPHVGKRRTALEEQRQTKRVFSSMARIHRGSDPQEIIKHVQDKTEEEVNEAIQQAIAESEEREGV